VKYATAAAFRQAIDVRLSRQATEEGIDRVRLQRRLAFERFLARLFHTNTDRWVLKGGYALELRLGGRARSTKDMDFNAPPGSEEELLEELRDVCEINLGDFLRFSVFKSARGELLGPPEGGHRFRVEARLDTSHVYATFLIDVGQGDVLLNPIENLPARVNLEFAELPTPAFPSYPLPEHFAEKFHAYTRPRSERTRVKDLVDLTLLIEDLELSPNPALARVIEMVFETYHTHPLPRPDEVEAPPETWREPYRVMAEELGLSVTDTTEAFRRVQAFLTRC
jgi:predicted nucleotidyltransferase component of viral defense system